MSVQSRNYMLAVSCVALLALARLATGQDAPQIRRLTAPGVEEAQGQINQSKQLLALQCRSFAGALQAAMHPRTTSLAYV